MSKPTPPDDNEQQPKKLRGRGCGTGRGRKLGSKNKRNVFCQKLEQLKDAQAAYLAQIHHIDKKTGIKYDKFGNVLGDFYGETPLEFMLAVMHDAKAPTAFRFQAAKESAPYRHAKLASIEVRAKNLNVNASGSSSKDTKDLTVEEAAKLYKDLLDG